MEITRLSRVVQITSSDLIGPYRTSSDYSPHRTSTDLIGAYSGGATGRGGGATSLFLSPEDFCDAFCVAGSAFDAPARFLLPSILLPLSSVPSPLLPLPSFLCSPPSAVYPLLSFPLSSFHCLCPRS